MKLYFIISLVLFTSCYEETIITSGEGLEDWSTESHSSLAEPNYDVVFPSTNVNRFTVNIEPEEWESMQDNLSSIYSGSVGRPGESFPDETPDYFSCDLEFNEKTWYHVGIRYKGNSSLQAYSQGVDKLPFRFDFDGFEDDYPEITNQTFYGFPALSMSSNYNDQSLMRERSANELFRSFGVPAPASAFYEMYIDYGEGPIYFGLYTAVEVVFETMLKDQFGSDSGNCYKPEDDGATFSQAGFNLNDFENKTTDGTGVEDIQNLYDILHSQDRTSDEERWKSSLESVFDVDGFLKWLAVNTTIQNWDTYGRMPHNYYLYHDPADDLIKWIPWDNNEAFDKGKRQGALSFDFSELNESSWPLIGYLINVNEYKEKYKNHISEFLEGPFEVSRVQNMYSEFQSLIANAVESETRDYSFLNSTSDFYDAVDDLKNHASSRISAAESFLE